MQRYNNRVYQNILITFQGQQDLRAARLALHCPLNIDNILYKLSWLLFKTKLTIMNNISSSQPGFFLAKVQQPEKYSILNNC